MTRNLMTLLTFGLLSFAGLAQKVEINKSYNQNKEELRVKIQENKPVMIIFSASWCGPCNQMKKNVWNLDDFMAYLPGYDFEAFYMDIDENRDLAS